ncbi:hypothetical protein JRQ81_005418 [Phrynocephalus forsythii]|uniref:Uncharacterized protein n=1 Tax=Phrynocephalus forsythii TaxID=171643 RepID=A0A9Q1AVF3_9SAUR|nr:hypothetical protein JRQ81_005418 [Phrynocephalus forsythii]
MAAGVKYKDVSYSWLFFIEMSGFYFTVSSLYFKGLPSEKDKNCEKKSRILKIAIQSQELDSTPGKQTDHLATVFSTMECFIDTCLM